MAPTRPLFVVVMFQVPFDSWWCGWVVFHYHHPIIDDVILKTIIDSQDACIQNYILLTAAVLVPWKSRTKL